MLRSDRRDDERAASDKRTKKGAGGNDYDEERSVKKDCVPSGEGEKKSTSEEKYPGSDGLETR